MGDQRLIKRNSPTHDNAEEFACNNRGQNSAVQLIYPREMKFGIEQQPRIIVMDSSGRQRNTAVNNEWLNIHQAPTRPPPYCRVYKHRPDSSDSKRIVKSAVHSDNDGQDVSVVSAAAAAEQSQSKTFCVKREAVATNSVDVEQGIVCGLSGDSARLNYLQELADSEAETDDEEGGGVGDEESNEDAELERRSRRRGPEKPMYRKILNYITRTAWSRVTSSSNGKPAILINVLLSKTTHPSSVEVAWQ